MISCNLYGRFLENFFFFVHNSTDISQAMLTISLFEYVVPYGNVRIIRNVIFFPKEDYGFNILQILSIHFVLESIQIHLKLFKTFNDNYE